MKSLHRQSEQIYLAGNTSDTEIRFIIKRRCEDKKASLARPESQI